MSPFDSLKNLLFIDIETASVVADYEELPDRLKPLWDKKGKRFDKEATAAESYFEWAPILAEFAKVITIGVGYFFKGEDDALSFKVKAITHNDETAVLEEFKAMLEGKKRLKLVAHNGLEFDYPFLCRRMLINGISLPKTLNILGAKSWEIKHLDTLHMWKFGEYRHYTSLELLAALFNIESSKSDLDGSQVNTVYHRDQDLARIVKYCLQDVIVTARVYLRMKSLPELQDEHIVWVD
ncbi:MAG: 3'-5' exonuclease [Flammeovirgaceae bacterium]